MNKLEGIYQNSRTASEYVRAYLARTTEVMAGLDHESIAYFVELLLQAKRRGNNVFFVGNGGSSATATHFANDLAICTRSRTSPFRAISLTDNHVILTTIANDFGYAKVFVKQLETFFSKDDLLVAISASGNSPNVLEAVEYVKNRYGTTIGLTGFDGGKLRGLVDYSIHVPTDKGEFGPVEDMHLMINHIIGTYLMYAFRNDVQ